VLLPASASKVELAEVPTTDHTPVL